MEDLIPKPEAEVGSGLIPSSATNLPQEAGDPEAEPLLFSFEQYNEKECQIDTMDPKKARKALRAIRDTGLNIKTMADFGSKLPKLELKPVRNEGDYRDLYKGLNPDTDLQEIKTDNDKGRIFFHMIKNILYLIAVRESHYETDKQRR